MANQTKSVVSAAVAMGAAGVAASLVQTSPGLKAVVVGIVAAIVMVVMLVALPSRPTV